MELVEQFFGVFDITNGLPGSFGDVIAYLFDVVLYVAVVES